MKAGELIPRRAKKSPPTKPAGFHFGVDRLRDAAELGSDPNSAQHFRIRDESIPELGSDPNSAGQSDGVFEFHLMTFSPSSPYFESANSFFCNSNGVHRTHQRQLTMVRRIGVRAQFGGTPPASFIPFSRIEIRPQICFCAPDLSAAERLEVNCQPALDVDITVGDIPALTHGARHVHL